MKYQKKVVDGKADLQLDWIIDLKTRHCRTTGINYRLSISVAAEEQILEIGPGTSLLNDVLETIET